MKFSIVIPSLNQSLFIERTLRSVVTQQGEFELEVIVQDGGSTDGTVDILKRFERQILDRSLPDLNSKLTFSWVTESDRGQSHAINKGLAKSTGDCVTYINTDDTYRPGALAHVATLFKSKPNALWCYGRSIVVDENDHEVQKLVTAYRDLWGRSFSYAKLMLVNFLPQPAVFWRRSIMQQVGYFLETEHYAMDYEYWCRLGKISPAEVIPHILAEFRAHASSKSMTQRKKVFDDSYRISKGYSPYPILSFGHWAHAFAIQQAYRLIA